jgi:hypothetical protein
MIRLRSGFDSKIGRRGFLGSIAAGSVAISCSQDSDDPIRRVRTIQGHPGETLDLSMAVGASTGWGRSGTAMDPDNLYFLRPDGLFSILRTGGPVRRLSDVGGQYPCVAGDTLYWVGLVSPTTQTIVRASRFGSSTERLFDLDGSAQLAAIDGRLAWQYLSDTRLFTAKGNGSPAPIQGTTPDTLLGYQRYIYWRNLRGTDVARLSRDGSVSSAAIWQSSETLFDIDDDYAYGFSPPTEGISSERYTWFRRPQRGGPDQLFEVDGMPFGLWSAGGRVLVGVSKMGLPGIQLSLLTPGTGSVVKLFSIESAAKAVVDEWGIFWQEGMKNHDGGGADKVKVFYYEFPQP